MTGEQHHKSTLTHALTRKGWRIVKVRNFVKAYYATDEKVSTMLLIFDGLFSDPEMNAAEIDTMSMVIRNKNAKLQPKQ